MGLELHDSLRHDNGLGVRCSVGDRHFVQDGVVIDAMVALGDAHIFTVGETCGTQPGPIVEAARLHYQRVVPLPMTSSVSEPRWVGILGKGSPVGPDGTPRVFALEALQETVVRLYEFKRSGHEHDARKTNRIALQNGIIPARSASRPV